jgi:hypothetical protein
MLCVVAVSVAEAAKEEQDLRAELRKQTIPGSQLQEVREISFITNTVQLRF